ncbi:transposase [Mesorhizobium sp. M1050]|uniref:transposase n=1 Tax=Mesorhizobium sp. M1050 TaxID=2957051 RepID=UPI00333CC8D8
MSHVTLLTGPERRRRWSEEDQCRILAAAFASLSTVAAVARQYDVATSLIYKGRRTLKARETGFAEVIVVPDEPVAASVPAAPPAVIELEIPARCVCGFR